MPAQTPNAEVAVREAVDCSPEEEEAGSALLVDLPGLGDEFGVSEQEVEDVGVQNRSALELLAEVVATDGSILLFFRQEEINLLVVEPEVVTFADKRELTLLLVRLDLPALREEWVGVAVHNVVLDDHISFASGEPPDATWSPSLFHTAWT